MPTRRLSEVAHGDEKLAGVRVERVAGRANRAARGFVNRAPQRERALVPLGGRSVARDLRVRADGDVQKRADDPCRLLLVAERIHRAAEGPGDVTDQLAVEWLQGRNGSGAGKRSPRQGFDAS